MKSSFTEVAPFYDELMANVPYRMWVSYYLLLLSKQGVHPKELLDVCCGTGSASQLLVQEGFAVTGFDLSATMIEVAKEKAKHSLSQVRYECADAVDFDLGNTYDAAYSFFDSLNYITEAAKLQLAFERVHHHLRPGGSFIFDMNTAYAFEAKLFDQSSSNGAKVKYKWKGDWNRETRLIKVSMKFWVAEQEYEELHVQRAYSEEEVRSMLQQVGFADLEVFDSYTINPPRLKSDRVFYAAIKP